MVEARTVTPLQAIGKRMIEHPNVIPIAVVVAICIFLAKEVLEFFRRIRLNGRKMHAIKRFLAAECERNSFAIGALIDQVTEVDEAHEKGWTITLEAEKNGLPRLGVENDDGDQGSGLVRPIHDDALKKYLFEMAALDGALFSIMEAAIDATIEAAHVRDSLIEYVSNDRPHLGGFKEYAIRELDDALDVIRNLYFKCTNEPLAKGRVR